MIERICQQCGAYFLVYPYEIKIGKGKFCSRLCLNKYLGQKHRGVPRPENVRIKISKGHAGKLVPLEARNNMSKAHKGEKHSTGQNKKMSKIMSGAKNPFYGKKHTVKSKEAMSAAHKRDWQGPEYRAKQVQIAQELWQNSEFVVEMMKARNVKPTRPEKQLESILNKHLPEYKYNGDGRLGITLGGLTPDFVNVDGKKNLIEVFGDYYHSPEVLRNRWRGSELGKIMVYNSLGWRCLVIWAHELKELSEEELVSGIKSFFRRRKKVITKEKEC